MKKLIASLICAAMVAPALAGPPAHGGYRGGYNRAPVPMHGVHHGHHGHGYRGPVYYGGGGYYGNPWYWAAPVIGFGLGVAVGSAYAPTYSAPVYVERPVGSPSVPTRMIDGVVHELRYVWYDDCQCNRATWVPIQ